ncbi:GYD domain-containing protein [Steroidobacter flavus]|uniref:GYD domain-containing protein n=1 Tax=Steroidobacter flavus TaxID=1842136 RepID=A0ABV8T757_9GAMM
MATYISLLRYTQQGMEKIKESPARLDAARKAFEQLGANLKAFYLVTGRYDAVVIAEAADATAIAKASLALGARGNVRTEMLLAFTEEEFRKIVGGLP